MIHIGTRRGGADAAGGGRATGGGACGGVSAARQNEQKRAEGLTGLPHLGQTAVGGGGSGGGGGAADIIVPHWAQNFAPTRTALPHFGQGCVAIPSISLHNKKLSSGLCNVFFSSLV